MLSRKIFSGIVCRVIARFRIRKTPVHLMLNCEVEQKTRKLHFKLG